MNDGLNVLTGDEVCKFGYKILFLACDIKNPGGVKMKCQVFTDTSQTIFQEGLSAAPGLIRPSHLKT